MAVATYGGFAIFGLVQSCVAVPNAPATQKASFFGVNGQLSKFGGTRGTKVTITAVLNDSSMAALNADEQIILSYCDGVARTLTDVRGRQFDNMLFEGDYHPDPMGPKPMAGGEGWCFKYTISFVGLTP